MDDDTILFSVLRTPLDHLIISQVLIRHSIIHVLLEPEDFSCLVSICNSA